MYAREFEKRARAAKVQIAIVLFAKKNIRVCHFSANSRYPKIQFPIPYPSLIIYTAIKKRGLNLKSALSKYA